MDGELDRRVAIEVMGEPEPPCVLDVERQLVYEEGSPAYPVSRGECWLIDRYEHHGSVPEWKPVDFSGNFDEAMRAANKVLKAHDRLTLSVGYTVSNSKAGKAWEAILGRRGANPRIRCYGDSASEAICRALLDYKEKEKG